MSIKIKQKTKNLAHPGGMLCNLKLMMENNKIRVCLDMVNHSNDHRHALHKESQHVSVVLAYAPVAIILHLYRHLLIKTKHLFTCINKQTKVLY